MQQTNCHCLISIWAVFGDLLVAVERIEREISNEDVKKWVHGYRDGLCAAQERHRITQSKCCCERTDRHSLADAVTEAVKSLEKISTIEDSDILKTRRIAFDAINRVHAIVGVVK
jgi:hypothetical protein